MAARPALEVVFPGLDHYESWRYHFFRAGEFAFDLLDNDGDGLPNGLEYAWGFDPKTRDDFTDGMSFGIENVAGADRLVIRFRRDPLAIDLDYRLQISSDLSAWSELVTVSNGAAPTGPGFVSELKLPGPRRSAR